MHKLKILMIKISNYNNNKFNHEAQIIKNKF